MLEQAKTLVRHFEGLRLEPYLCPAGYWTIGYGHRCDINHPKITETVAEQYLQDDLHIALTQTLKWCPVLAIEPEHRVSVIVDFTFNLGHGRLRVSTLRKRVNAKEWSRVPDELIKWVYGGGRQLRGLVLRRQAEILLWNSG